MRRKVVIVLGVGVALVVAAWAAWPRVDFWMMTGRFAPIAEVETLAHPVAVGGWTPAGLLLADGRTVRLPGLASLPGTSAALSEASKRGVEIGDDGRVCVLVRIHHWCGNDPVREHVARVDLADMLTFLRVGEPTADVAEAESLVKEPGGRFSQWGWDIDEFLQFQSWRSAGGAAQ